MKKFAYGAFALAAVGAAAQASDTGWSGLDQEINNLSASLAQQTSTAPKVSGFIIVSVDYIDGEDIGAAEDILGVRIRQGRIQIDGSPGHDYNYRLSFDIAQDAVGQAVAAVLKDAYVDWKVTDGVRGRLGQYKLPAVRSGLISDSKLLFLQRTLIGDRLGGREPGAMVSGQFDMLNFWINAQNEQSAKSGVGDLNSEDMVFTGRVTADIMGDGVAMQEGAYGAGDAMGLVVGGVVGDDGNVDKGVFWALEAALTSGPFSVAAEMADFDTGLGDNTPWDATASFLINDMYEVAVRYEDFDDAANTNKITGGVNRYVAGHDIKWTLQWEHTDTDAATGDADAFALGLVLAY
jgi:phosphate-selective porin